MMGGKMLAMTWCWVVDVDVDVDANGRRRCDGGV